MLLLEAHDTPGGYAHTFVKGRYKFCAQVHYIFGCSAGQPVHEVYDPEGFDHVIVGDERIAIPNGMAKYRDQLIHRFPQAARPLRRLFAVMIGMSDEIDALPDDLRLRDALTPFRFPRSIRYRTWTLQDLYDHVGMPGLRSHLAMKLAGTPLTNERFCRAPRGNAYGSNLSADAIWPRVPHETPLDNLFMVNASAGYPSVGGTMSAGLRLADRLLAS